MSKLTSLQVFVGTLASKKKKSKRDQQKLLNPLEKRN